MQTTVPEAGSLVWIRQRQWRVERATRIGDVVRLDVAGRDRKLTFLTPFDRAVPASAQMRARPLRRQGMLARCAGLIARRESTGVPVAAIDARVALLSYQLEPWLAVLEGTRRLLIADQVGLGKTIQAGLIIAEAQRRHPSLRALVVVPAALREQWRGELREKFGVASMVADRFAIEEAARGGRFGDNPWRRPGVWVTSIDYLRQTHVRDALPFTPWDIVVIDEAHAVCGDSERHEVSHDVARRARHVVLLSATPHSGDDARFARLEGLGSLAGPEDELVVFRRTRAMVATHLRRRVHWRSVNGPPAERRVLDTLAAFERAVLTAAGETRRSDALLLLSIFRKRALSSMRALGISVERRLAWIDRSEQRYSLDWVQPSLRFDDQPHEDTGDDEREGLTRVSGLDAMRERTWLRRIRLLAAEAERNEAKIARLCRMARLSAEPMVVFTEFRHSLEAIAHAIGRVRDVSLLHGGMTDPERQTAMRQFRDGHTSVLVATDVASQGLNLQERARWVVVFELPWSPARLEQRIGRVDRLGQTRRVHATLLVAAHPMESGTLRRLAARAVHANEAMGGGLFDDFTTDTAVTRALLCGAAIDTPHPLSTSRPRPSCRWQRRAAALRRYLSRRRAFARFWRVSPTAAAARYMTCHTSPAVTGGKETRLSVWSVPIIDSTGRVVERHLVAARVEGGSGTDPRVWLAAVETRARAQLAARLRRLGRVAASRAGRARAVEHAIAAYLMTQQCPEAFQPELFDRRAVRAAWHAAQQQDDIAQTARARVHDSSATATLTIGRASLELVVYARP